MSRFDEIKEREQERALTRARPSALMVAWFSVLLALGGVVIWLALTGPAHTPQDNRQVAETPPEEAISQTTMPEPAPELAPELSGTDELTGKLELTGQPKLTGKDEPAETDTGERTGDLDTDLPAGEPNRDQPDRNEPEIERAQDGRAVNRPTNDRPRESSPRGLPLEVDTALLDAETGRLPVRAADGREPWQVYARPFDEYTTRPRIAIVMAGLGLSSVPTRTAIETLPPDVTLAFSTYSNNPDQWIDAAREAGHEIMLMVPMEPNDYPRNDPGPQTLLVDQSAAENLARLHHVLSRATRYVGVTNHMGSRFTSSESAMTPILEDLKARGLLFMDARSSQYTVAAGIARELRLPRAVNNRYIDNEPNEAEILRRLEELENTARTYGAAAGIGRPYPVTIRTLERWAEGLDDRGFVLAPVSAIANRQPVR